MFFIGIFGIDTKEKQLRTFDNVVCGTCGRLSRATLTQTYTYFHIFFIPTFRWNKHYYIKLRCCGAVYEADEAYAQALKTAGDIDFSRLKRVSSGFGDFGDFGDTGSTTCAHCGARLDNSFSWCPHCGHKR